MARPTAKSRPDPIEVRDVVRAAAEAHARSWTLHPSVARSLDRYYETGRPSCLDVTIFRSTRNVAARSKA